VRLIVAFLFFFLAPYLTQHASAEPKRALPVDPSELTNAPSADSTNAAAVPAEPAPPPLPLAVPNGINIHWYGHGFVFITSSVGVRAAIDPFGPNLVHYKFPDHLTADFVLISHESEDHASADQIFGNPLIFRSVTAVGLNRANGTEFHGTSLTRDPGGSGGANTAFTLTFDGITMGYLGQISVPLTDTEKEQFGTVDVLFMPVGLQTLSVTQLNQVASDTGARVIIPINYKTDRSGDLPLRTLDEYLDGSKLPVRRFDTEEIALTRDALPNTPTIYVLKSP
jgi:L-ascorbate metabolism protein UlaG (beta-lactamase superfamily)